MTGRRENGLYIQTISVPGTEEDMDPVLYSALADEADAEARKAYKKAFGIISSRQLVLFGPGRPHLKLIKNQLQTVWWA